MERSSTDLIDVLSFVRVVETGSFARAAERMGLSKPVLSRRVARLEDQLGARLLTRSARGAQPTDIGQSYYARAANILTELEAAQEVVAEAVTQIAGPIRLTGPLSFGVQYLAPALAEFMREHPRIELDVEFDDRTVDLAGGGYDLAVRIGKLADSSLIARRIAPVRKVLVGSPDYLSRHGRPQRPPNSRRPPDPVLRQRAVAVPGRRALGDHPSRRSCGATMARCRAAAEAGQGFARCPASSPRLRSPTAAFEVLLRDFPLEEGALHAMRAPGRATTARVRALARLLVKRLVPSRSGIRAGWPATADADGAE